MTENQTSCGSAPNTQEAAEACTPEQCSSCSSAGGCSSAPKEPELTEAQKYNNVKNVIAVVSGKGGVGKSLVTSMLSVTTARLGHQVAVYDADITGPSMARVFGVTGGIKGDDKGMFPAETSTGLELMSLNLLLRRDDEPVIWRGGVITSAIKQFWKDVLWGDVDYMFVDMPPGTGDIPLTVYQEMPVKGIVIVTSPQDLVSMIVKKAYHMANMMKIPVLGIVENMSYVECPNCDEKIHIFGESKIDQVAAELGIPVLAQMPIRPSIAALCDAGKIEEMESDALLETAKMIIEKFPPLTEDEKKHNKEA